MTRNTHCFVPTGLFMAGENVLCGKRLQKVTNNEGIEEKICPEHGPNSLPNASRTETLVSNIFVTLNDLLKLELKEM